MKRSVHIPFQNLSAIAWKRLALAVVFLLFFFNIGVFVYKVGIKNGMVYDFLAYWSAGKVADLYGYAEINNIEILGQVENQQLDHLGIHPESFNPIAVAYFSIFLVPFQLFSKLDSRAGLWIWTIFNLIVLTGYGFFFTNWVSKNQGLKSYPKLIIIFLLISYPVYSNIICGQINTLLLICSGEFIRNSMMKRPLVGGMWLGGLIVKFPLLLLIIPALLLMKYWRVFIGFVLSAIGLVLASVALSGAEGMITMFGLWFAIIPGEAVSNFPSVMANWRMLAMNINTWSSSFIGWYIAGIGMLISLVICFLLCKKPPSFGSNQWVLTMMAIFAASSAFSWHSHIHMGMVLIPFLLFSASLNPSLINSPEFDVWIFLFPAAMLLGYVISIVLFLLNGPAIENLSNFLTGLAGLAVYMFIAIRGLKKKDLLEHTL